jgi:ubiquitin-conjugating enzyme E2 variant
MIASTVGEIVIGWLIADSLSGLFHRWQDSGRESWPFIGPYLIAPSKLHHSKPLAFTAGSFLYRNGATYAGVLMVAGLWLALFGPSITLASATIGGLLTTQVHYWAHCPREAPKMVRVLQEIGAFQSPKGHAAHHRPPHTEHFCSLTDWLNPIIKAFR